MKLHARLLPALRLPDGGLQREIVLILVIKFVALALLWQLFVGPQRVEVTRVRAYDSAMGTPASTPSSAGPFNDQ